MKPTAASPLSSMIYPGAAILTMTPPASRGVIVRMAASSPAYLTVLPGPPTLSAQRYGDALVLNWSDPAFTLQAAPAVAGTYTNIPGAISPTPMRSPHLKGSFD